MQRNASEKSSIPRAPINSGKFLALGFGAIILVGTLLLMLPISSAGRNSLSPLSALFTATSAVCVTGLTVINVSEALSRFGQIVLICLIQVGGLGFLVFSTVLFMLIGKRITLKDRLLIRESMNTDQLSGLLPLLMWVLRLTACVEGAGALLLSFYFIPHYGWGEGLFMSIFHAISAFCNAGFDLLGDSSLIAFYHEPMVLIPLMLLITVGGLGFALISDLMRSRRFSKMAVHTRLVLIMTGILTISGAVLIGALEWNNPSTLGGIESIWHRILNALFQSVTLRTAGFAAIDQAALTPAGKLLCSVYMFIGAAPASTGGGVKLTTFAALVLLIGSIARGREQTVLFKHTLPRHQTERATCVFLIAFAVVIVDILLLSIAEPMHQFADIMYESVSAFATVGLSCNLTPSLSIAGRLIIIVTMFIGRVGPLTLTLAIARRQSTVKDKLRYPDADIMIG